MQHINCQQLASQASHPHPKAWFMSLPASACAPVLMQLSTNRVPRVRRSRRIGGCILLLGQPTCVRYALHRPGSFPFQPVWVVANLRLRSLSRHHSVLVVALVLVVLPHWAGGTSSNALGQSFTVRLYALGGTLTKVPVSHER